VAILCAVTCSLEQQANCLKEALFPFSTYYIICSVIDNLLTLVLCGIDLQPIGWRLCQVVQPAGQCRRWYVRRKWF
jgi:hypothetical protein